MIGISGRDAEESFVLVNDLKVIITFSSKTDDGKKQDLNEKSYKNFGLVFNGLQANR
ncbi:MAG: hypothetical protein ACE5G1_05530 [bacterium]